MNNKTILGLAALGAAALYFLKGKKQAIENLQIKPLDISINKQKTNFSQLVFNFKVKAANPGNFAVKINEIDLDVLINGKKVSEFQKTNLTTILPGDAQTINLEIVISNLTVIDVVLNAIADKQPIKIALSGFINTDLGSAIIDVKKTINLSQGISAPYEYKITDCTDSRDCQIEMDALLFKKMSYDNLNEKEKVRYWKLKRRRDKFLAKGK